MAENLTTCWTLIRDAADGGTPQRGEFAARYEPVVRQYLAARWRSPIMREEIDDACQEFFLDCFRQGGALERAEQGREQGFRPFLYGIARIIALRFEERVAKRLSRNPGNEAELQNVETDETKLSQIFDRAWAQAILKEAGQKHIENAEAGDYRARRRVELLKLRFQEGLPIREIADLWQVEAAELHREYSKARKEFSEALTEVVTFHYPDHTPKDIERECADLLTLFK